MWRIPFAWYAARWWVEALWLKVATRVWLDRAWYRNGDRLVLDLERIEAHIAQHGGRIMLEPPYSQEVHDALRDDEDEF